jgi:glucose/mannose transport system permease protein
MNSNLLHRAILFGLLGLFALFFLLPLYVMVATSLKDMDQVRLGHLLSLPASLDFTAWGKAWNQACTGTDCRGLQPYFWNSLAMIVPAVAISTTLGALNGYILTKWRFKGSELLFSLMLFGVFMPLQVVLLPMSQVLGWLGLSDSIWGLVTVHVLMGLASTTLFFRNYYIGLPDELIKAAMLDGAGFFRIFWRIVLPLSTPILVVTLIWQFTNIWNDFLYGVVFSGADSKPITVGLNNLANTSSSVKEYNVDMAAAMIAALPTLLVYVLAGKYFVRGLTAGAVKGMSKNHGRSVHPQRAQDLRQDVHILKGIDMEIEQGEFLILVGPSGCGKSTLLNMIAGLDHPTAARIHIGERDVTHAAPRTATSPWCSRATRSTRT